MNFKKFISGVSAFAIAASAFAGMAVTASATAGTFDVAPTATKIHAGNPADNFYDANATSWTVNQSTISGGKFQNQLSNYGGSYLLISKFDASAYIADTIVSATLSFDAQCTVSGKNSNIYVATVDTGWDAATATWDSVNDTLKPNKIADVGNVGTTKTHKTVDVKSILESDSDGILGFALYTYTGREQEISNYKLTVETTEETLYDVTFTGLPSGAKVTVGNDDATNGLSLVAGEYSYTATAVGYKNATGSFTVSDSAVEVPVTMTAVADGSAFSVPADAVSATTFADAYTSSASGQIAGYDTYGDGSNFYATADFIISEGGKVNLWFGTNSSSDINKTGTGTSLDLSEAEIRYYTNTAGTKVDGTIEADTWYRVSVSSDLVNTLGGDFTNLNPVLHFDVIKLSDNSSVASFNTGYRNANKGIRYIKVSANNQNTVNNVYTYFVEDPSAEVTNTAATTYSGAEYDGEATSALVTVNYANMFTDNVITLTYNDNTKDVNGATNFTGDGNIVVGVVIENAAVANPVFTAGVR